MSKFGKRIICTAVALWAVVSVPHPAYPETMLQYFNTTWKEMADKIPELAEAGYSSIWIPPPTKASGGLSTGYDLFDPFDLGGRSQRGTVTTRYGTEAELLNMIETAHRFGLRIYADNIMNHRAFDIPAYNESTDVHLYPGMVPEDFHLRRTADGFYRKWDNVSDWENGWQVVNRNFSDLIDIAQETPNVNHGLTEGSTYPKPSFVRHPDHPEFYDRMPNTNVSSSLWNPWDWTGNTNANLYIGFGPGNGLTTNMLALYPDFFQEDVSAYLNRAARWLMQTAKLDGLRLDAVKHVPDYFFGAYDSNTSSDGYNGNVQWQFNLTRGFNDWDNHRDSNFDSEVPRNDALLFGEHLGSPPGVGGYISAGMRLVDNDLRSQLNWRFSAGDLAGYDTAGTGGFAPGVGIMHCQSHDNDIVDRKELQHAYYFLRAGIGLLYTDGNYHSETLGESGGAFPRWANTSFLGQWGQGQVPELLKIHENMARYEHVGKGAHWDGDVIAWERGGTHPWNTALVVFNSRWSDWLTVPTKGSFPDDAYLYNYARAYQCYWENSGPAVDYAYASQLFDVNMPPNSYAVWGWKNPDPSLLWPGSTISIYDNGELVSTVMVSRKDGPDGDPGFNPYGLGDTNSTDFTYAMPVPRITGGSNVVFNVRVDGSANNVLMRLDGGMDLNGATNQYGDLRDNAPGTVHDMYLGYEAVNFVQRIWPEKFASSPTTNCQIGALGSTSYQVTIGQANAAVNGSAAVNNFSNTYNELRWVYHDPNGLTDKGTMYSAPSVEPRVRDEGSGGGLIGPLGAITPNSSYVFIGDNPAGATWYNGSATYQSNNFNGYNFSYVSSLKVGGELTADSTPGSSAFLCYEIRSNNVPITAPMTNSMSWVTNPVVGKDQWQTASGVETVTGLSNGTYGLSVWFLWNEGGTNNVYDNRGGSNYIASFTLGTPPSVALTNQYYLTVDKVVIWTKTPKVLGTVAFLYYTTDGSTWPEGAGGAGANAATKVANGVWQHTGSGDDTDWWKFEIDRPSDGTTLRYKIGAARRQGTDGSGTDWETVWPGSADSVYKKKIMLGEWNTQTQNLRTKSYHKHNDYNSWTTAGLPDGFHLITARAFLNRDDGAPVFNTFKQTFYLDVQTPEGYVQWPANDGDMLYGSEYGVVVRADSTVREVWYRIEDADDSNDDAETGKAFGNGEGFEPFTDANGDGDYDSGEPFTDLNGNTTWDSTGVVSWQKATTMTPDDTSTTYPQAWRFTYANLATGGTATIRVRLREWSSTERGAWTNSGLTEAQGHFREIVRTVQPRGVAYRLYFDWPSQDGEVVEAGWTIRVKYTDLFTDGLDEGSKLTPFSIWLNSSENGGEPTNGVQLTAGDINLQRSGASPESTISFTMPNVYNGVADWLHSFAIIGQRSGYPTLRATRKVKSRGDILPSIIITDPPELTSDGQPFEIILPDLPPSVIATNPALRTTRIQLSTGTNGVETGIYFTSPEGYSASLWPTGTNQVGNSLYWDYAWSNLTPGYFRFTAWVRDVSNKYNTASRGVTLRLLQVVDMTDTNDLDHDDDGLEDTWESTLTPLPNGFPDTDPRYTPNQEFWTNRDIQAHNAFGRSLPQSPDSDGDGLHDGLELGWRLPSSHTDTNTDTNGDGWPNFMPDLDPPFYNTLDNFGRVPGVDSQSAGGDRAKFLRGSMTDPANRDSDYDGISDGVEDGNRNGWVDGDGQSIDPTYLPWSGRDWPTGLWDEQWTETSPSLSDTDVDGLSDGYGEDKNFNGWIDGDTNSNRVWNAGELWTETNPLDPDTDGDGLPDGWEVRYSLDPWNDGVLGHTNLNTGAVIASLEHGAQGDPDGDTFNNLSELLNGTNPREYNDPSRPPPPEAIIIGPGDPIGVINGRTNYQEFTDWALDDLIALDDYNNGGIQAVDIYRRWDGYDTSRDMVAFYVRDGGAVGDGGSGKVYFRVDFQDLQTNAEQGSLDLYVLIDFNSTGVGERALPDELDGRTDMKWEAVAAIYDSQSGSLYVDGNQAVNTQTEADSLPDAGVFIAPNGFQGAYFNAELDAVEFAIDRAALVSAGWGGNASNLNFQVISTKDGTCNSCDGGSAGAGDLGGRIDTCDIIRNTSLCSDYWRDQDYISQNPVLTQWVGRYADNDVGKSAKIALLAHGNQAIQPGSYMHTIVDDNAGAGYQRPVKIHSIYQAPLNLHITPTLAIALEWAEAEANTWRSGRGLNDQIRGLVASNIISLMASTYSDHALPYFTEDFNSNNVALATETLNRIYGADIDANSVFWPPERLVDGDVFDKIKDLGFQYSLVDQNTHIFNWYGRPVALGDDGYRINEIHGVKCFVINNAANDYRYTNHDVGLPIPLRELFSRRARSGSQNQVATIFCMWEEFATLANADAYDVNVRWLANRPWMQLVALKDIADGSLALPWGQNWDPINRGNSAGDKQSHDWINHATAENYDNWYDGSAIREGLRYKRFEIRPGVTNPTYYGMLYFGGLVSNAWAQVASLSNPDVKRLAGEVIHASVFETAFHNENNHNLSRWSYGGYIYPSTDWQGLAEFALVAQNQTRMAALYGQVDAWAAAAPSLTYTVATNVDSDLDGEQEYWLYNSHVAAMFERIGGRMIAAWHRNPEGRVRQMIGNLASYAGSTSEVEGAWSVNTNNASVVAYRTSALKDWWAGTSFFVNDLYTATTNGVTNGWKLTSSDTKIAKTITLAPTSSAFAVSYAVDGSLNGGTLYVRNGLSPDLSELLVTGQRGLVDTLTTTGALVTLSSTSEVVGVRLSMAQGSVNISANDDSELNLDTVAMRNQAQTRQVEVYGTSTIAFDLKLEAEEAVNEAPVLAFAPSQPVFTNAVGTTNSFVASATDADDDPVTLASGTLPFTATFNSGTGLFFWSVTNMYSAGTTNLVSFTADDGVHTVTGQVSIIVPWDANGNGMPDDWEYLWFDGDMTQTAEGDYDEDSFPNYAEWVASTDPGAPGSYVGWDLMYKVGSTMTLTFQAVPGRIYHVEGRDTLVNESAGWFPLGSVTNDGDNIVQWTDASYPSNTLRNYRIKIPSHAP